MRLKILITILALSILTVGTVATASAQLPGTRMSAQIPFDFMVGEQTLPAGTYELRRLGNDRYLLCIQNIEDTRNVMIFNTSLLDDRELIGHSALVFHRYGDVYFLARIVSEYEGLVRRLTPSEQERSMERDLASNKKTRQIESVPLAAN